MEDQSFNDDELQILSVTMQGSTKLSKKILKMAFESGHPPPEIVGALALSYASLCRAANMPDDVSHEGLEFFLQNLASFEEAQHAVN